MKKNTLIDRIMALAKRSQSAHDQMGKGTLNWEQYDKDAKEMDAELTAIDKAAGPGLNVGRCLTFGVADGNASYIITKIRKNDVIVEWVPLWDGYWSQAVGLNADKTKWVVNRNTAEMFCR